MKPCANKRKAIAWLAAGALNPAEAASLRAHLTQCAGCRRYYRELADITEALEATQPDTNLEVSEEFYAKVAGKIQAVDASFGDEDIGFLRSLLGWRNALPAVLLVVMLMSMVLLRYPPTSVSQNPSPAQLVSPSGAGTDMAPTLANYQMVANQSLEKFSELLTKQGNKRLPPVKQDFW